MQQLPGSDPLTHPLSHSLAGLRPRNLDVKALLAIFEMLQQHYPERLDRWVGGRQEV